MATPATVNPFNFYPGRDGLPLQNGYLYFGEPFQDPELQPLQAYWDDANTQPAARPIRTINGYPARNGTPAQVFVAAQYSMRVRDSQGREVFYAPNVTAVDLGGGGLDIITASGGQTVVNLTNAAYTPGSNAIDVSLNGLILISGQDYFETGTTRITMASALSAGDQIRAFARSTFGLTQAVLSDWQAEVFDGDGTASQNFTLTRNPGAVANMDISVAGSTLRPLLDYTLSGNVVTITPAPAVGTNNVLIRYGRSLPQDALRGEMADPTLAANNAALIVPSHALNYAVGTLGAWYNTYVTAKDRPYLATGDGVTDDAAAMNAALASGYKRVHFPFGTYKFNDHITIPAGVSVTADPGTKWLSDGTADVIITGSATVKTVIEGILFDMASSTRQVYGESADNVTIRRCGFTGSTNNGLLMSVGPHYLLCVDCDFYDNGKAGLYVAGDASRAPEYIELRSCRSWGNGEGGQVVAGVGSRTSPAQTANWAIKVKLVDCESWGNGTTANSGFELVNMDGLTVTGCSAWDNREHGLSMQETRNFTITGGRFYENDFGGICPQSGYGNDYNPCEIGTITGVIMDGNAAVGFWCKERVLNVAVTGCHIMNNTLHNIRFSDLGGSLLYSEDISFVNCFTEPSPGAAFTNSNSSLRISYQAASNEQAFPLQPNAHNMLSIATAVTINTRGTDEAWPSLVTLDNSTPVNVSRTAIAEAYDGRRITLRAYLGGTVQINNAAGNGTTLAGFINNTGAAVVMQAGKSLVYIGNGVDFVEEGS